MKDQLITYRKTFIVTGDFWNNNEVWNKLLYVTNRAKFTVLTAGKHEFYPQGLSGFIIIGESHVSIHTFPEKNKAWLEVATCGETEQMLTDFGNELVKEWALAD